MGAHVISRARSCAQRATIKGAIIEHARRRASAAARAMVACAVLAWALPAAAGPDMAKSTEEKAIGAFLAYCLPALSGAGDVTRIAEKRKLRPVPTAELAAYLQDVPGKVFELPDVGLGVVLTVAAPACSVMLEKVDARAFMEQTTYWFSNDQSPFRLTTNRTLVSGDIEREYRADIEGRATIVRVNLRLKAPPNAPQAMLTGGRE